MLLENAMWLACLLETEGSIGIHKSTRSGKYPRHVSAVRVSMTTSPYLEKAVEFTGLGKVSRGARTTTTGKPVFTWSVQGRDTRSILLAIWPFLLIKRRQVELLLALNNHIESNKGCRLTADGVNLRDAWYRETRSLNK